MAILDAEEEAAGKAKGEAIDLVSEIGDAALAHLVAGGALDGIPILGGAVKLVRGGMSVRDALFEAKLGRFLRVASGAPTEERSRFKRQMDSEPAFARRVGAHLVTMLDRFDDIEKAEILGQIFRAFLAGRVSLEDFRRFSHLLDRITLADLRSLRVRVREGTEIVRAEFDALEAVGLVAIQHSTIRKAEDGEIAGRVDIGGTSHLYRVLPVAVRFVEAVFSSG